MSNERIRQLLSELREETRRSEIDDETRVSLRELDADIHELLDPSAPADDTSPVLERARQLEASFSVNHPTAGRVMREVIDALVKIGV